MGLHFSQCVVPYKEPDVVLYNQEPLIELNMGESKSNRKSLISRVNTCASPEDAVDRVHNCTVEHEHVHMEFNESESENLVSMLGTCLSADDVMDRGGWAHSYIVEKGLKSDPYVGCTFVHMYMRCGSVLDAYCAFIMILIGQFMNSRNFEEVLKLFLIRCRRK